MTDTGEVLVAVGNIATTGESTQQGSSRCRDAAVKGVANQGG